jgi:hypothetical protein
MTRLTVDFDWELLGALEFDAARRVVFPKAPPEPGLYRLWYESADERPGVYIGEAANLRQRLQHYRTPGVRQATNVRRNEEIRRALGAGSRVTVCLATVGHAQFEPGTWVALNLSRKNQRLVLEQAAIAAALLAEELSDDADAAPLRPRLLNRPGVGEEGYG